MKYLMAMVGILDKNALGGRPLKAVRPESRKRASAQVLLPFPPSVSYGEEDFILSSASSRAFEAITEWKAGDAMAMLLSGPQCSGKTHLGRIWCAREGAVALDACDLSRLDLVGHGLQPIFLDNIDRLFEIREAETKLFHLLNWSSNYDIKLLMTLGERSLDRLLIPDLRSRLLQLIHVELGLPDDETLVWLMTKLANDTQLQLDPAVVHYALTRIDRNYVAVARLIKQLDERTMNERRRVTKQLVGDILAELEQTEAGC